MSAHGHAPASHGGHEMQDFEGRYAIWAVPFSLAALFFFVLIIVLWVPSTVSRELRNKDVEGAEASRAPLLDYRAKQAEALEAGEGRIAVEQAMAAVVRESSTRTP